MAFTVDFRDQGSSGGSSSTDAKGVRGAVTISEERKVCTGSEKFFKMCESNELDLTFHLFVCALAGAGAAVMAMVHFLMALAANWGYLKDASRMQKYEDIKSKEEQELHDIHSTRSKERLNAYT
nr:PREDICTED: neuronal membrane glycoprotein M6-a-like [Paralichthys olivaceus]